MATLVQRAEILRGLLSGEEARVGPFFVDVDLTNRCNLQCVGCLYHSPYLEDRPQGDSLAGDLPLNLFERLCSELGAMGTTTLVLQGAGEPMLHPDLPEIIQVAKSHGFDVELITNGILLTQEKVEALLAARLDGLKVSLWASSPDQYQYIYPGTDPEYLSKVVDGLKLVAPVKAERCSDRPLLAVYQPLSRHNFQSIDAMVELAYGSGCNGLLFAPLGTVLGELSSIALGPEEEGQVRRSLSKARQKLDSLGLQHNIDQVLLRYELGRDVWRKLPCYMAWLHARIRVDGSVQPCGRCDPTVDFGNLNEQSFPEIWNSPAIRAFRRRAMTKDGLASIGERCDCNYCCFVGDNLRVHRIFRWLSPFVRRTAG